MPVRLNYILKTSCFKTQFLVVLDLPSKFFFPSVMSSKISYKFVISTIRAICVGSVTFQWLESLHNMWWKYLQHKISRLFVYYSCISCCLWSDDEKPNWKKREGNVCVPSSASRKTCSARFLHHLSGPLYRSFGSTILPACRKVHGRRWSGN